MLDCAILENVFKRDPTIEGSGGGGKAKGSGSTAKEAPNTLRSKAIARIIELLGEGQILGLKEQIDSGAGSRSIYVNKVPVENPDSSKNYPGFAYEFKPGTSDQEYLPGFESVASEFNVGLRVRQTTPVVYRSVADNPDALVVTIAIPSLTRLDDKDGSLKGHYLNLKIEVRSLDDPLNTWVTKVQNDYISGKNTQPYEKSYRMDLDGPGPWLVRVSRLTPDSDEDSKISDELYFSHITELQDYKIGYVDSAIIGFEIDTEQFTNGLGDRQYDIYGKLINYPSNYNPVTGVYTGFWDGTWLFGYCNNPAWVFMDICLNPRYGIGLDEAFIDKWGLYQLAQYCDDMVPDGQGGEERRFTFNGTLYTQEQAYKVLQQICSLMRGLVFYSAGAVIVRTDGPQSPESRLYTSSNVIGDFNYASTAKSARHTACMVQWRNPDLGYEDDYAVYEDNAAILKYGYNLLSIKGFGTTSRGQAYRQAKWAILTEQLQKDTVTFEAGYDSADVLPGDVIEIADPHWATADFGGRLIQPDSRNLLTVYDSKLSTWGLAGVTRNTSSTSAGPWGERNLQLYTASAGVNEHYVGSNANVTNGSTYTFSVFVRPGTHRYFVLGVSGTPSTAGASFDLQKRVLRRRFGANLVKAKIERHRGGLYRIALTFNASNSGVITLAAGFDSFENTGVTVSGAMGTWNATGVETAYFGAPQLELGTVATVAYPGKPNGTSQIMLDRDIEYTGATSPSIHLTLLDGPLDDVPDVDNTDRPIRRKLRYFSSPVSAYDPETQIVTLLTAMDANDNDETTPLIWIFSKEQQAPRPYKVITNEENVEDHSYTITAVEYVPSKFTLLDEGFVVNYGEGGAFSNLPSTATCKPPSDLRIEPSTQNGRLCVTAGWTASPDMFIHGYIVSYKRDDDNWQNLPMTLNNSVELIEMPPGSYIFNVRAINKFGNQSSEISNGLSITEQTAAGQQAIVGIVTDRGDTTFADRDIQLYWLSNALSQTVKTPSIIANVFNSAGDVEIVGGEYSVTGGDNGSGTGAVAVSLANPAAPTITFTGTFTPGDSVIARIGHNVFVYRNDTAANMSVSNMADGLRLLIDADPRFTASQAGGVVTIGFTGSATNANDLSAQDDPLFRRYRIRVRDAVSNTLKRTEYTNIAEYKYTYSNNQQDFTAPVGSVKFEIDVEDIYGVYSTSTTVTVTNASPNQPMAPDIFSGGLINIVSWTNPIAIDLVNVQVLANTVNNLGSATVVGASKDEAFVHGGLTAGDTWYYWLRSVDSFGNTSAALSIGSAVVQPLGGFDPELAALLDGALAAADDNILTGQEKANVVIPALSALDASYTQLVSRATAFSLSSTNLTNSKNALYSYLDNFKGANWRNTDVDTALSVEKIASVFPGGWVQVGTPTYAASGPYSIWGDDASGAYEAITSENFPVIAGQTVTAAIVFVKDAVAATTRVPMLRLEDTAVADLPFDTVNGVAVNPSGLATYYAVLPLSDTECLAIVSKTMGVGVTSAKVTLYPAVGTNAGYNSATTGSVRVRNPTAVVGSSYNLGRDLFRALLYDYRKQLELLSIEIGKASIAGLDALAYSDPMNYASIDELGQNWELGGTGEYSIVTSSDTFGRALQLGNNSGNDYCAIFYKRYLPFSSEDLYEVAWDVEVHSGTGLMYLGVNAQDRAGNSLQSALGSHPYVAGSAITENLVAGTRKVYRGYFRGTAPRAQVGLGTDRAAPAPMPNGAEDGFGQGGTVRVRPMALFHYSANPGRTTLHSITIRKVQDATIIPRGFWSSSTEYFPDDGVVYYGRTFGAKIRHTNQAPPIGPTSNTYWYLVSDSGANAAEPWEIDYLSTVQRIGNTFLKTANNGVWGSAFKSTARKPNAVVSFRGLQTNAHVMVGLTADDTDDNYTHLDYCIYLVSDGTVQIYENGSSRGAFGTYTTSDWFTVRKNGTIVEYLKNGLVFYTSLVAVAADALLRVDSSFHSSLQQGVEVAPLIPDTLSAWTPNLTPNIARNGTRFSATATTAWDAGFYSSERLCQARVSFRPGQANAPLMVGLNSDPTTDHIYTSIDYAMYCTSGGLLYRYENGAGTYLGASYVAGDLLWVEHRDDTIIYGKNNQILYTLTGVSATSLLAVDSSFNAAAGTYVYDVTFSGVGQANYWIDLKYQKSITRPATPTTANPAGWSDSPQTVGTGRNWITRALKFRSGALASGWSQPESIQENADRGTYSASETYYLGDTVRYNGGTYVAVQDGFTNHAPSGTAEGNTYWDVVAAPGAPGEPGTPPSAWTPGTINVPTTSGTVNLRELADANGYTGLSDATVTFAVPAGVNVTGLSSGGIGIRTGTWPTGSYTINITITVASTAIVRGGGGRGGTGASLGASGSPGSAGGHAFFLEVNVTGGITITSGGLVQGGGGGGGGGGLTGDDLAPGEPGQLGGSGGGGGRPNGGGAAGGEGDHGTNGSAGTAATTTTSGAGGTNNADGGSGGSYGVAGTTGATGGNDAYSTGSSGGAGGAAGYAVKKNGFTCTVTGTVTGTVG